MLSTLPFASLVGYTDEVGSPEVEVASRYSRVMNSLRENSSVRLRTRAGHLGRGSCGRAAVAHVESGWHVPSCLAVVHARHQLRVHQRAYSQRVERRAATRKPRAARRAAARPPGSRPQGRRTFGDNSLQLHQFPQERRQHRARRETVEPKAAQGRVREGQSRRRGGPGTMRAVTRL